MADQVLRYKVELDDSDLSQQLEAIREKINSEISSFTAAAMTQTHLLRVQVEKYFLLQWLHQHLVYQTMRCLHIIICNPRHHLDRV